MVSPGGQGSQGRNALKQGLWRPRKRWRSIGGKKDGGTSARGRDIGVRILQRGSLGAEQGSPADTGRYAHRGPPRGAQGREPRGREPPREAAEAALVRCHVWGSEALFGAIANRKGKANSQVSGGFFGGREGPSAASAFRRGSPGIGPGRHGQARSEGCGRRRELRGSLAAGGSPRSPVRRKAEGLAPRAEGRGREDPTPTHLRAPSHRHVRKRRRSARRRRAPAPYPPLPGRSRRPGGLASRWLRRGGLGSWRETLGGGGRVWTASARLLVHLWNGRGVTGVSGFVGGPRSRGQGWA